jgi:N-dimethylarginine dimethylaminohydrolase
VDGRPAGSADASRATRQWQELHALVSDVATVELIDPMSGLPDMVFTANAGLIYRGRAVPSHFRHAERAGEEPHFTRWFAERDFDVTSLDIEFEGAGDALFDRAASRLWFGHGHRSDARAAAALQAWLGDEVDVVPLRLADPLLSPGHLPVPAGRRPADVFPGRLRCAGQCRHRGACRPNCASRWARPTRWPLPAMRSTWARR